MAPGEPAMDTSAVHRYAFPPIRVSAHEGGVAGAFKEPEPMTSMAHPNVASFSMAKGKRRADREWFADGLPELFYGGAFLATALFFFVWAEFSVLPIVVLFWGVVGDGLFRNALTAAKARLHEPGAGAVRRGRPRLPRWRLAFLLALLALFVALAVVRVGRLESPSAVPVLAWTLERWWPVLLTVPIPLLFVASSVQLRIPRHLVVGLVSLVGGVAGPLLDFPWRDTFALAAAVQGGVLVAAGGAALRAFRRAQSRPPGR